MFGVQHVFVINLATQTRFFSCALETHRLLSAIESTFIWVLTFNHDTPRTNGSNDLGKIINWGCMTGVECLLRDAASIVLQIH